MKEDTILNKKLEQLKELIEVMLREGNWNHNSYAQGLTNGLILSAAVIEETKPEFLEKPETWLQDLQKDGLEKKE